MNLKQNDIDKDYEIGKTIAEECIPFSLEYYLGINPEEDDYEDCDEEDDEENDDDDEEEDDKKDSDEDDKDKKKHKKVYSAPKGRTGRKAATARNRTKLQRHRSKTANNNDRWCVYIIKILNQCPYLKNNAWLCSAERQLYWGFACISP